MQQFTKIFEAFKFYKEAKKRAEQRKAAADKTLAVKQKDKDTKSKSDAPATIEIAYNLLKLDNFDVDEYLKASLDVPRDKMPQISDDDIDNFLIHFGNRWGGVSKELVPIGKLKPTQNEINIDKVRDMIKNGHDWQDRKYLVGKEFHLADAHHSCICGLVDDPSAIVTVYRTKLPIKKTLEILRKLKFTDKKDINDKNIK